MKKVLVMGSTGSIGCQTLDIIREHPERFGVSGLTCHRNIDKLLAQIAEFHPSVVCVGKKEDAGRVRAAFPAVRVLYGEEGLKEIAESETDLVLNALMGISGLAPTERAVRSGHDIALANKETLVAGGELITALVREKNVRLLPVDSEHSAIFQCLEGNRGRRVKRMLLTASGGPFRGKSLSELEGVTRAQALAHPKWQMGSKITIDSATMMNKGLEVIEAKWLFDVAAEQIEIHVHPESIVHSMVEFEDASILAQMGLPDMRIPISLALGYPDRLPYSGESLDLFTAASALHFERPDREVFDCINMAYEALREGGSYPVLLNGANEELVSLFLQGEISFLDIQRTLRALMERHRRSVPRSVEEILEIDREARFLARERSREVRTW